jgi:hypothetical protein
LKGITIERFAEIVDFINQYQKFGKYYTPEDRGEIINKYPNWESLNIKYIEPSYDTRTKTIWAIKFQGIGQFRCGCNDYHFPGGEDLNDKFTDFGDYVMAVLTGEQPILDRLC